jgi:hypothetical protein
MTGKTNKGQRLEQEGQKQEQARTKARTNNSRGPGLKPLHFLLRLAVGLKPHANPGRRARAKADPLWGMTTKTATATTTARTSNDKG